jgi:AraC-like DNA-binding protein
MPVTIRNDSREVLYHFDYGDQYAMEQITSPTLVEKDHEIAMTCGKARFSEVHFDGFVMGHGSMEIRQRLHVESNDKLRLIGMHFMLRGEVTANIDGVADNLVTSSQEHSIVYNPDSVENLRIEQQPDMKVFGLSFSPEKFMALAANNGPVLDQYAEKVENRQPVYLKRGYRITPKMMQVIEEVTRCHFTGGLKKLFLQSKAIELLALQCEQVEQATMRSAVQDKVTKTDEERIYHARDLLLAHAQNPLSLGELARKAGINEFKLKSGFRKVFDNTVFGYLSDYRLDQARELVREGAMSFTEIAGELGYSSLQHFSNAFRKKFGISPREVKHT